MEGIATQSRPDDGRRAQLRGGARVAFLAAVIAAGFGGIAVSAIGVVGRPPGLGWGVLVALTIAAAWFPVRMAVFPMTVSLAETFTMTAAVLFGPGAATIAVACDGLVMSLRLTRSKRTATRVLFNVAAPALAMWVAARAFEAFLIYDAGLPASRGTWSFALAIAAFIAVYFVLSTGLVAGAVAIGREATWSRVWREHFLPLWVTYVVGGCVAGLAALAPRDAVLGPAAVFVLPLIVVLLHSLGDVLERLRRRNRTLSDVRTYAAALRSTTDPVILFDPKGHITFINPAAEELTGWTRAEAEGRAFVDVVRTRAVAAPATESTAAPEIEHVLISRDGTPRQVEETLATIRDEDGNVIGTIATLRDISARKAIETARRDAFRREREARRASDEANRAKDEFLALVSHELRTPAGAIAGWTQLLSTGRLDPTQTAKAIAALERNVRAHNTVLNDLLDVSRIVRGTLRLERRRVDLAEVLSEALDTIQPAREARRISVETQISGDVTIDADPDRLRQVFWNLLANAVKFTPEGGWIRVSASRTSDQLSVQVIDNGCGIDPALLPYIFEPFRQGDDSGRLQGGLGLGLAIVKHLIEAHGGTVSAASDGIGKGASFTVSIPAHTRATPEA